MKRSIEKRNRIWLEIERHNDDEANVFRAKALSKVLTKLGYDLEGKDAIWWNEGKQTFCITTDTAGSYKEMSDNGHWFSLDHFSKDQDVNFVLSLAASFMGRAKVQDYKGKTGDKAAIDFFAGAMAALQIAGLTKALDHVSMFAGLVLQTRGMRELEMMTKKQAA